ncbi:kinase-like protein, partial [Canariomyces notabilis]
MAQTQPDALATATASMMDSNGQAQQQQSLWRRLFSGREKDNGASSALSDVSIKGQGAEQQDDTKAGLIRRVSRKVVPGLPRAPTFKRQQSELRSRLEPVRPTPAERRAVSMDRRMHGSNSAFTQSNPRTSAPDFLHHSLSVTPSPLSRPTSPIDGVLDSTGDLSGFALDMDLDDHGPVRDADASSKLDVQSMTTSQYDAMIDDELERIWILNLSMHFRDKSKREKFFVTYREHEHLWRRVTISLDYRCAPEPSLELDLAHTKFQRDKSAKIYDAIRESLPDIQFYDTVTNLKLETKDGRLHVHVVEDVNEIIHYPSVRMIQHMNCRRVKEREIQFDSHMSGFVYKVRVHGRQLIKKEIPGPDTVEEFLYEINALNSLQAANNVIQFYGVVVDEREELVTGLLISYAERGALIDVIYDHDHSLPWPTREKWARQIVTGLSEIHEAGFVQGDFTLSNIVIDKNEDAKIIDINRRGCPIGWEPPEATPMIESGQRISMYIGVKSDLYQLGMVLWALAMQEDEPEAFGRPLKIDSGVQVPAWYKRVVDTCLSVNPRNRLHACQLLSWFPDREEESHYGAPNGSFTSLNDDISSRHDYIPDHFPNGVPRIMTVHPPNDWAYVGWNAHSVPDDSYYYPARGRSPPSPMPSNQGDYKSLRYGPRMHTWSDTYNHALTVPSVGN